MLVPETSAVVEVNAAVILIYIAGDAKWKELASNKQIVVILRKLNTQ